MFQWSMVFLAIAIISAVLGFGGVALAEADAVIARFLFFVFLLLFLIGFVGSRRYPDL